MFTSGEPSFYGSAAKEREAISAYLPRRVASRMGGLQLIERYLPVA